jgi:hypothetical protein
MLPFLSKTPANPDVFSPDQEKFIRHFLPYTANSTRVSDNLKMSLIIEALLMNMWTANILQPSKALSDAIEKGITARTTKCRYNKKTKEDKDQQTRLQMSGERLNLILDMLTQQNEMNKEHEIADGLDGTDDTPLSTLDSDIVANLVNSEES